MPTLCVVCSSVTITVTVEDYNDNDPVFIGSPYSRSISEVSGFYEKWLITCVLRSVCLFQTVADMQPFIPILYSTFHAQTVTDNYAKSVAIIMYFIPILRFTFHIPVFG